MVSGGISLDLWTEATPWTLIADDVTVNAVRNVLATNDSYTVRMAGTLTVPLRACSPTMPARWAA